MGSGRWDTSVYDAAATHRAATGGRAFAYSHAVTSALPPSAWKAHRTLDPKGVALRESRDSAEHPNSRAVTVLFDVTGSMAQIPERLQEKLPELLGLLLRKGYLADPQVLFGAIGDATCDAVPLQIGQWESDNRMDDHLTNMVLEKGGGGEMTESYELGLYFMDRHTAMDCYEKRGEKGFLFLIGDEMAYPAVKRGEVARVIGDRLQADVPIREVVRSLRRRFRVYFILPKNASYGGNRQVLAFWRDLLGQNVIELEEEEAVCETIALAIGLHEGIDLDEGLSDLADFGVDPRTARFASAALVPVAASVAAGGSSGALVRAAGGTLVSAGPSGARRL